MGVQQRMSSRAHHALVYSMIMIGLIIMSACGAADVPDGDSNFVVPTDPPSSEGPLPTADDVLEGMVGLIEVQQNLAVESYVTYEVLQSSGQLLSFNTVRYVDMRRPNLLAWTTVRDDEQRDPRSILIPSRKSQQSFHRHPVGRERILSLLVGLGLDDGVAAVHRHQ